MNRTVVCDNHDQIRINLRGENLAIGVPAKLVVELIDKVDQTRALQEELKELKAALRSCREAARNNFSVATRDFASMCGVSATQISEWTSEPITTEPNFKD